MILHAPIGGGKTRTAEAAAEWAKTDGLKIMGILSRRVLGDSPDPSYEILELDTGEVVPLVKPAGINITDDWESLGNPRFVFSSKGFLCANLALQRAAEAMHDGVVTFIDEYGRLESQRKGIYSGAVMVANALRSGGVAIFLCRDDMVQEVNELIKGKASRVFTLEAGNVDALLRVIRDCSKL